ncbi:MAG: hypothetical protein H6721_34230 [Sandaracinus sp.]|nr:hypothetical protein [Sandaracinus sp.]MCB9624612.1 hypothetical protein [Sandaracinus sp.]MCB9636192.1 hypothetical protein [Sandaracinus sp.]MCB9637197.1 hypothetical protein [Sandaracinus sp.]
MTTRTCDACGGPLRTRDRDHRSTVVVCEYCGIETSLASPGAEAAAGVFEAAGIRLPEQPKTRDELYEEAAEREARERERLHRARLLAAILTVVSLVVLGTILALAS